MEVEKDKAMIDFIEMLVTRLTNIEEKMNEREKQLDQKLEHIDNLREAGSGLSGLVHCDPPREAVILKHYGPFIAKFLLSKASQRIHYSIKRRKV